MCSDFGLSTFSGNKEMFMFHPAANYPLTLNASRHDIVDGTMCLSQTVCLIIVLVNITLFGKMVFSVFE